MMYLLDLMYLNVVSGLKSFAEDFCQEEKGVSTFVATIILMLIVVLLCALFWEKISGWFGNTWNNIMDSADTIGNNS